MSSSIATVEVRKFETLFKLRAPTPEGFDHILFIRGENRVMRDILTGMFADPGHAFVFDAVPADPHYPANFCKITGITRILL